MFTLLVLTHSKKTCIKNMRFQWMKLTSDLQKDMSKKARKVGENGKRAISCALATSRHFGHTFSWTKLSVNLCNSFAAICITHERYLWFRVIWGLPLVNSSRPRPTLLVLAGGGYLSRAHNVTVENEREPGTTRNTTPSQRLYFR